MKTFAILLLLVLGTSMTSTVRRNQSMTAPKATASVSGSAVKPAVKAGVKVGVNVAAKPAVKAGVKVAVKPAVKAGVKVTVPKVTIPKVTVPKVTVPKVSIGVKSGTSGSVSGGVKVSVPSIKVSTTAKATAVDLTGSCPQAKNFGFTVQPTAVTSGAKFCKGLKASCCTAASIESFGTNWAKWTKELGNAMWNLTKVSNASANLITNLKPGFGASATPAPAPAAKAAAKRILQSMVAVKPAVKAGVKVGVKVAAKPAVKAGVKVAVKPAVKAGVKLTVPKVTVPKVSIGVKSGTSGSVSGGISGGVKVTVPKVTVKKTIKVTVKVVAPTPMTWNKDNAVARAKFVLAFDEVMKSSAQSGSVYELGQRCFLAAIKLRGQLACASCDNKNSVLFTKHVKVQIPDASIFQNSCVQFFMYYKNINSAVTKVMDYVGVVSGDAAVLADAKSMLAKKFDTFGVCTETPGTRRLQGVVAVKPKATVKVTPPKATVKVTVPKVTVPKVTVPKVKVTVPTVKVTVPTVKVTPPKVTGSVKISVGASSAVVVQTAATATSWSAWKGQIHSSKFSVPVYTRNSCLSDTQMQQLLEDVIFGQKSANLTTAVLFWNKALDHAYKLAGSEEINKAWVAFQGTYFKTKPAPVKVKVTVKAPATAAVAAKKRLQAVKPVAPVAPVTPVTPVVAVDGPKILTVGNQGINLETSYTFSSNGLALPAGMTKGDDQVQMASAKIAMFTMFAAIAMMFF